MEIAARAGMALACALGIASCGGGGASDPPPPPPVVVSLGAPSPAEISENENPMVEVTVSADSAVSAGLTVPLTFSGTASRDQDYAAGGDSVVIPAGSASASMTLDVYRDFDAEGDETITVSLGAITGNARAGTPSSATWTILDGEAAAFDKTPEEENGEGFLVLFGYAVTEDSVDLTLAPSGFSASDGPQTLVVEWSGDADFATGVNLLGEEEFTAPGEDAAAFFNPYPFSLPLSRLAANARYYVRAYIRSDGPDSRSAVRAGFATGPEGRVVTRCRAPMNGGGSTGPDPLFAEQWHLSNTAQTGLSGRAGVAGADLRMNGAIEQGRNGSGAILAVVDTGLEVCHPDLAANIEPGKSWNFGYENTFGASRTEPFNPVEVFGDHGTSVAGVAGAVANNGVGGRGVAPAVRLRGYNPSAENPSAGGLADFASPLLASLGGSGSDPDSASAHIFNMSFGEELPGENSEPDFVQLYETGVTDLRSGRGALYVKAAGNEFDLCEGAYPLQREIGCIGSNSDPDQNLPYLVNVGAFNAQDVRSSYSSAGANLWVVAPAGEDGIDDAGIITTDQVGLESGYGALRGDPLGDGHPDNPNGDYTAIFGGTSAAAPSAAGAIAVLLGVNPGLTWRDVKHILAKTARRIDPDRARVRAAFNGKPYIAQHAWQTNAAGYAFHNWYGFGAVSIDAAIAMAADYTPDSLGAFVESGWFPAEDGGAAGPLAIPDADGGGVTDRLTVADLPDAASIEAVMLEINVAHSYGSDIGIMLTSPGGTESIVHTPFGALLREAPGFTGWRLLSNAFYGENPNGEWAVDVVDLASGDTGQLDSWRLRFYHGEHPPPE